MNTENESWDPVAKKTKNELSLYYKNSDYHNPAGYKSPTYGLTYYDGYGYNFYNGNYGYYEYSRPPTITAGPPWNGGTFAIFMAVFLAALAIFIGL